MGVIDEMIDCLTRHDRDHRDFYQSKRERVVSFINSLGVLKDYRCTEDRTFEVAGARADLYLHTDSG